MSANSKFDRGAARVCEGNGDGNDVFRGRPEPQRYLEAQIRWRPLEIAFWLATLLPFVLTPNYLLLASQIAITALFALSARSHPRLCGHRVARPRRLFRLRSPTPRA